MKTDKRTNMVLLCLLIAYLALSVVLQCMVGSIDTSALTSFVGLALGVSATAFLFVLDRECEDREWERQLRSSGAACVLLALSVACCIVGGSLPTPVAFRTSWWFVGVLLLLEVHLALVLIHRLRRFRLSNDVAFFFVHIGLWLALFSGMVGEGDTYDVRALVSPGESVSTGMDAGGKVRPLGFSLHLYDLKVDADGNGKPVHYEAGIMIDSVPHRLAVNAPVSVGFSDDIYISGYRPAGYDGGKRPAACVLQIVRQPWKYPMLLGIVMLMVGIVWYVFSTKPRGRTMPC